MDALLHFEYLWPNSVFIDEGTQLKEVTLLPIGVTKFTERPHILTPAECTFLKVLNNDLGYHPSRHLEAQEVSGFVLMPGCVAGIDGVCQGYLTSCNPQNRPPHKESSTPSSNTAPAGIDPIKMGFLFPKETLSVTSLCYSHHTGHALGFL